MKNLIFYSILLLFFIVGCGHSETKTPVSKETEKKTAQVLDNDPCINSGFQIFKLTAELWVDNWETLHTNTSGTTAVSPELFFSKKDMDSLKILYPTSDGVRLYYVLANKSDTIPNLAMKPMKDCDDLINKVNNVVLYSDIDGNLSFLQDSVFQQYKNNWQTDMKMNDVHHPINVYAYNYGWQELLNRISSGGGAGVSGIWVRYGFRTLGPEEVKEYEAPGSPKPILTGNVVYCNIVYGQSPARTTEELFDFVKPCPRFCNN